MAANVTYLKGVRTRYRNIIQKEIQIGVSILQAEVTKANHEKCVLKATKCIERLKCYVEKLENQSSNLASAYDEETTEVIDGIVEEDCELCSEAMDCQLDLHEFNERLVREVKIELKEEHLPVAPIVQIQEEIKGIVQSQMKMQHEMLEKQKIKEQEESSVKLPKLEINSFGGDKLKWIEFWDSFESTIHKNKRISNVEKFNYLKSKLTGEAMQVISGLTLSNENYAVAINILKERYGNVQDVVNLHYNKMINLQPASNTTSSLRLFHDNINKHLRSLEVLHQDVNQDVFVSIVTSKLPQDVLLQLEIQKGSTAKWTIKGLCERLLGYVNARERSERNHVPMESSRFTRHDANKGRFEFKPRQNQGFVSRNGKGARSAEALTANVNSRTERSYFDKCKYCQGRHWSDECPKYTTIEERKNRIRGSCYKCLKFGHNSAECKRSKLCVHCGDINSHHRSLCPRKYKAKISRARLSESANYSDECSGEQNDVYQCEENVLVSSGEMVLMQTAKTEIKNPINSKRQEM